MARPKKLSSEELVALVDAFFSTEASGDPSRLKCSLLEDYASSQGIAVKAYDFRRDEKVRARMEQLKCLVHDEKGMTVKFGAPYKNLDIEQLLKTRRDPDSLRQALGDLDAYWQKIYELTLEDRKKASEFTEIRKNLEKENETLKNKVTVAEQVSKELRTRERELIVENRYLRKMLRTYLYPALANEILTQEQLLKNADTEVTAKAKADMIDGKFPSSVKEGTTVDTQSISAEEKILQQMWDAVPEVTP